MHTRVAYLGPPGTYAEQAAFLLAKLGNLAGPEFVPYSGMTTVIENVANKNCDAAVVPIENSVEGAVTTSLDSMWNHPELFINRALVIPIEHALLSVGSINEISEILSHPQALAQCSNWLKKNLPHALQLPTQSTAEAVKMVQGSHFRAAIASRLAVNHQEGIRELAFPINDISGNRTRFVLLKNKKGTSSGDVSSLAFSLHTNAPGALLEALSCIASLGLNLSKIESRPSKRELGEYVFFVDVDLTAQDNNVINNVLESLEPLCEKLVHFGSYECNEINKS